MIRNTLWVLLIVIIPAASIAAPAENFSQAKKQSTKLYQAKPETFYCGCQYAAKIKNNKNTKKLIPDWESCGYQPRKNKNRASRIEWEHVMPAHHFGHQLQCWQQGGRKACKKDSQFNKMESDLHNLVPAIGEVNGDRSNFKFGMIEGEKRNYGACDIEIDFKAKRAEPREAIRGDIARIYFYMHKQYNLKMSAQQEKLFKAWAKQDPVDEWEQMKNNKVKAIQGNGNPFIDQDINNK